MRAFGTIQCFRYFLDAYVNEYKLSVDPTQPVDGIYREISEYIIKDLTFKKFTEPEIKELLDCIDLETGVSGLPVTDDTFYKFIAYGFKLTDDRVSTDEELMTLAKIQGFALTHGLAEKISSYFNKLNI